MYLDKNNSTFAFKKKTIRNKRLSGKKQTKNKLSLN